MKLPVHKAIGYLKKAQGKKGALRFKLEEKYKGILEKLKHVFLEVEGQYIPFFIRDIHTGPPRTIRFDSITTPEGAKRIAGASLYIREYSPVEQQDGRAGSDIERLVGFRAMDGEDNEIGPIEEIRELPQQMMAVVRMNGKEVLIPLHAELILGIDRERKTVHFSLPEGMLDL